MDIDCHTPTNETITFTFNRTPTLLQQLTVNKIHARCFTPTIRLDGIASPGLSPIYAQQSPVNKIDVRCFTPTIGFDNSIASPGLSPIYGIRNSSPLEPLQQSNNEFKKPNQVRSRNNNLSITPSTPTTHQLSPNGSWNAVSPRIDVTPEGQLTAPDRNSILLDTSRCTGYLNHNTNVFLILKNVGLEQYAEIFEKESIDLEKFLDMKWADLKNLGLNSDEHCKIITKILKDLNGKE